jgi:hypothetical protein
VAGRCEITELPVGQCACRVHGASEPGAGARVSGQPRPGWFEARYPGQCRECGEPFQPGTHITGTDGSDGWTAECCADEVED